MNTAASIAWKSIVVAIAVLALKALAAWLSGSVALLSDAVESIVNVATAFAAFAGVLYSARPPDNDHPYGHEKAENVAAGAEAMLILLGAAIVVIEAVRRLFQGSEVDRLGFGITVIAISIVANLLVSAYLYRRASALDSPALEGDAAHLRTDSLTSIAVLVGLLLVEVTGITAFDSIAAILVAFAIVATGVRLALRSGRVLMDEALPGEELDLIEGAIAAARPPQMAGYHKLRARSAGSRRHIDLHVQFRSGTSLEEAHRLAHALRDAIAAELPNADVLIHVEPEDSYRGPEDAAGPLRHG